VVDSLLSRLGFLLDDDVTLLEKDESLISPNKNL
jgi:hypothetical protein